jgi:hypothetical protein
MRPDIFSGSSHEEQPSLGASVEAILAGWRREAQACTAPGQRVRALLTTRQVGEQEMLRRFIAHGWFFAYRLEPGQKPVVLHAAGIEVQDSGPPALSPPQANPARESAIQPEAGVVEAARGHEAPLPAPTHPESAGNNARKRLVPRGRALLLLCGAATGSGVIGWFLTGRSAIGLALAALVLALALLGRHSRNTAT